MYRQSSGATFINGSYKSNVDYNTMKKNAMKQTSYTEVTEKEWNKRLEERAKERANTPDYELNPSSWTSKGKKQAGRHIGKRARR